jgi:hypothetical protein
MIELLLAEGPCDPCWELPRVSGAVRTGLLGWRSESEPIDAGVPPPVAAVIADALCRAGAVVFLGRIEPHPALSATWQSIDNAWVRSVRVGGRLWPWAREVPLICTRAPATAVQLFEQDAYPWHLRGQAVLLTRADQRPPNVSAEMLRAIFDGRIEAPDFVDRGVDGLMLPAVDGDFAGLFAFDSAHWTSMTAALEVAVKSTHGGWRRLSEPEMKLAFSSPAAS